MSDPTKPTTIVSTCARIGCEKPARFVPHFELFDAAEQPVARIHTQVVACEEHTSATDVDDFIPQPEWDRIVQTVRARGQPAPIKKLTRVIWTPMLDLDEQTLQAVAIATHAFVVQQMQRGMFVPNKANGEQLVIMCAALAAMFVEQFELDAALLHPKILAALTQPRETLEPETDPAEETDEARLARLFGVPRGQG